MLKSLTWRNILAKEKHQPYFINIIKKIMDERKSGIVIYPPQKDVFNAFHFTEFSKIKVVIIGQDPYPNQGQANGLAFSVRPNVTIPPSLINIYKELERSIYNFVRPNHGYLESWARQGVFLLNTILTVRCGQSRSHANLGWEIFTDKVIYLINKYHKGVVFLLWGSHAKKKESLIDYKFHYVLKTSHPSPLSANLGFISCNHFVLTNNWLKQSGKKIIDWNSVSLDKY